VHGCSSSVWLLCELSEGRCRFRSDADSPVVRGLVALLAEFNSHATPAEIVASDADPLDLLDLKRALTPTRRHGLEAVSNAIRAFAESHLHTARSPDPAAPQS
jgi:cysteine desulfuration protein SufE